MGRRTCTVRDPTDGGHHQAGHGKDCEADAGPLLSCFSGTRKEGGAEGGREGGREGGGLGRNGKEGQARRKERGKLAD